MKQSVKEQCNDCISCGRFMPGDRQTRAMNEPRRVSDLLGTSANHLGVSF